MRKIKIGEANVKIALKNGRLVADLTCMAAYGGKGRARITANARGRVPSMRLSFALSGFQANPFLSDAMDLGWLEGTANTDIELAARGRSQRELVSALDGGGSLRFLDGAIRGINLAGMVRLAGRGTVDLPRRTVKYRLEPKLVATTTGQGGRAATGGITVPVIVEGSWDNLRYRPDLSAVIGAVANDPKKVLENLKGILKGGTPPSSGESSGSPLPGLPNPADALKRLFGR